LTNSFICDIDNSNLTKENMKKIVKVCLPALCALAIASCAVQQRMPVNGVIGQLVIHPVGDSISGNNKTYNFLHDFPNQYLYFTDNDSVSAYAKSFLPEYISVDSLNSIGRMITVQSVTSHPFSHFTPEMGKEIEKNEGVNLKEINNYQIAMAFNERFMTNSLEAKRMLLNMLLMNNNINTRNQQPDRIPILGAQGMLTYFPIKNTITGTDSKGKTKTYYLYFIGHYIYFSDDESLYKKIVTALPMGVSVGDNAVLFQGIAINPVVYFDKKTLEEMADKAGIELNGQKNMFEELAKKVGLQSKGQLDANEYTFAKISACSIVLNYQKVIDLLEKDLRMPIASKKVSGSNASNASTDPNKPWWKH
jgi:hypothetical protein